MRQIVNHQPHRFVYTCQLSKVQSFRMGNVIGNSSQLEKDVETEEWLRDLEDNLTLDFSRKVTHGQFLKVSNTSC